MQFGMLVSPSCCGATASPAVVNLSLRFADLFLMPRFFACQKMCDASSVVGRGHAQHNAASSITCQKLFSRPKWWLEMSVIVTPIESNEQWHALRRTVIGASEAGALVGVHEYVSYYALWARKSGRLPEVVEDNGAMERGRRLEPVAIDLIRDRYPQWHVVVPHEHYADREFGIGATPDLLATDENRRRGSVQIKSVAPAIFRRNWYGDSDALMPPLWIQIQALMEAHLVGSEWAKVAALVVDHEISLYMVDIPLHAGVVERIKTEALHFWQTILSGREPDPDYARDGELIRAMLRKDDGSEIDLSEDNELPDLVNQRETILALAKQYEGELKTLNAQLLHRLGEARVGRFNGGYISAKTVNRPEHSVKATSYRQLRVVRDKNRNGSIGYGTE